MNIVLKHAAISLGSGEVLNRSDPLGIRFIMGAIEKSGNEIGLFLEDRLQSHESIIQQVLEFNPSVLWVSVQPLSKDVIPFLQKIATSTKCFIVLGNVGAKGFGKSDLESIGCFTVVVDGKGEHAVAPLIHFFQHPCPNIDDLFKISNLRWVKNNCLMMSELKPTPITENIYPSLLKLKEAISRGDIINARSSSGCNGFCTFCTVRTINNNQTWRQEQCDSLRYWIENIIKNGKKSGAISMTDDDLANTMENLEMVSEIFSDLNSKYSSKLTFNFSTRADHLFMMNEPEEKRINRQRVWRKAKESGLDAIFLGLESGSKSQLRRLGKGYGPEINFEAINLAQSLGIRLEIGLIPIDPLMNNESWRQEMLDNIVLAKHVNVSKTAPTWLAPARIYRGCALEKILHAKNLLDKYDNETGEYSIKYLSPEVVRFLDNLGPVLCQDPQGKSNHYYRFKREFKTLQRRPILVFQKCASIGEKIIELELNFVEWLIKAKTSEEVSKAQKKFSNHAIHFLRDMAKVLFLNRTKKHADVLLKWVDHAILSLLDWHEIIDEQVVMENIAL